MLLRERSFDKSSVKTASCDHTFEAVETKFGEPIICRFMLPNKPITVENKKLRKPGKVGSKRPSGDGIYLDDGNQDLPTEFKERITILNGSTAVLVIEKPLSKGKRHNRLSIPMNQVMNEFLRPEEKVMLSVQTGKGRPKTEARIIGVKGKKRKIYVTKWKTQVYNLVKGWNRFAKRNKLRSARSAAVVVPSAIKILKLCSFVLKKLIEFLSALEEQKLCGFIGLGKVVKALLGEVELMSDELVLGQQDTMVPWQCIFGAFDACKAEGEEKEKAIESARESLSFLEEQIEGKTFFGGEKIGFLDLAVGWIPLWLGVMEQVGEMKLLDAEKFPSLHEWSQNFIKIPLIKEALPPREKLVDYFTASVSYMRSLASQKQ
ncbi:hypothetical protein RHSIM_Rhsim02G0216000 [Rhododendron simsii]|uniref:glutathione transferase n=1 Tax=Rhododendron simsii TaxID=118357 RepID=A0A834HB07_RHOSS|nr:hypothetical protein RHSIM_Rhsim02G0216000 [Rhododendron simsii]